MAQTLEHNKAVTTVVPVSIPTFDDDLAIIQKLDDEPNDVGGLTAMELKAKFDEGNVTAQQYINNVLIPAVVADGLTEQARQSAEAERVANEIERVGNEEARVSAEEERERAIAKVENMTATATTLPAGSPATAEIVPDPATGAYNVKLGIPAGKDGYGAGDMLASTYDPAGKRQDVFKYSDTKISEHNSSTSAHADIRTALDGKAPSGYGLGGSIGAVGAEVPMNDAGVRDFNKAINTGWYWIYPSYAYENGPLAGSEMGYTTMLVERFRVAVQTLYVTHHKSAPVVWRRMSYIDDFENWYPWQCVSITDAAKIVTGSYTGTGTFGNEAPCSLTFDFEPKIILMVAMTSASGDYYQFIGNYEKTGLYAMYPPLLSSEYESNKAFVMEDSTTRDSYAKKVGNTVYWYHRYTPNTQANTSGCTYHYMAIG